MSFGKTTPILRMFDESKTKEFYVDFLGFKIDWEHRFDDGLPLYMQVSKDGCVLHLSEHHGDCTPGAAMRIETTELEKFNKELLEKQYKYARPGLNDTPWGTKDMTITDPSGNRLTFTTAVST
jgi:uncharacterized glyoxalase superfamily protein PhnB